MELQTVVRVGVAVAAVVSCVVASSIAGAYEATEKQRRLVNYLIGPEEPTIKDAKWMTQHNLYVGVLDNGTNRDGFAEYVCMVTHDHATPAEMVKVVDIVKVAKEGKFKQLGKAWCGAWQPVR